MESQSLTARRSAASNLPNFQLPPPDLSSMHKYPPYAPATQSAPQPVSSVLTPPSGLSSDGLSPLSSSVNSGSSQSSTSGVPPYNPSGYWPGPQPAYQFSSAPQMPAPFAQNNLYMGRQMYSPGMNYSGQRSAASPASGEAVQAPPYNLDLPPFPTSNGPSGGPGSLPTLAPQQQQSQQQPPQQSQQQQQQMNAMMNMQQPASQAPQNAAIHSPDNYGARPPPTPTYNYAPSSTPQQSSFPAYAQPSPTQQSPITSGPPQSRISPVSSQHPQSMQPPPGHYQRAYNPYPLPAMSGPIMSNLQNPGSQMQMVGGMNMQGYPQQHMGQHMSTVYGGHPGQQQQQNDRPFKCDQCPQSFNRNHDLKRHKRIHLAVKPFPCTHCEKSFSRKDALKRHILVKGCGKGSAVATLANGDSQSPLDKSEVMSDSTDDNSPKMTKKEI